MWQLRFGIAVIPALFLLWLFQRWDQKRPEPPGAVRNVCLWGAATTVPAILIEVLLTKLLGEDLVNANGHLLNAFVVAAVTEETLKLAVILVYLWKKPHFDEVMDGILYTAASSLGFALIENVLYSASDLGIGLMRAFTAVPLHATCSGIMGYFVGRAKFAKGGGGRFALLVVGWCAGVGIHGFYDWAAMSGGGFGVIESDGLRTFACIAGVVVVFGAVLRGLVWHALKLDDLALGTEPRPLPMPTPAYPQPGYPMAPGYPQQPYPQYGFPQQPGYPQPGYPQQPYPQQHGYPQPGYPQQPYPQTGYPQQPYPQTGYPQPGYPQQPYPQQPGYPQHPPSPQPGYPPQAHLHPQQAPYPQAAHGQPMGYPAPQTSYDGQAPQPPNANPAAAPPGWPPRDPNAR
jgi:RsiW-degrading membrane proteinase PrsW (M82 family)